MSVDCNRSKSVGEYSLDSYDIVRPDLEIAKMLSKQLIKDGEASAILPQESDQHALSQYSRGFLCRFVDYHHSMDTLAKCLNSLK